MILPCETPATGPAAALAARLQALVPILTTERLILRAPRIEDFSIYAEIVLSPRGTHLHIDTREDAWYDFSAMVANWLFRGHGVWTITPKSGAASYGFVLLGFEPGDEAPELGYMITDAAEGQGIALEAAEAARHHAMETLGLQDLVSYVEATNTRSIALAERLGATRDGTLDDHTICYRHTAGYLP